MQSVNGRPDIRAFPPSEEELCRHRLQAIRFP
jgi:hypothetical protein